MAAQFAEAYPNIAERVESDGWIEMGGAGYNSAFVKAIDEGGLIWEGNNRHQTIDEALRALDTGLAEWIRQHQ